MINDFYMIVIFVKDDLLSVGICAAGHCYIRDVYGCVLVFDDLAAFSFM